MATQEKKMATPTSTLNVSTGAHAKRIARQLQHIDTQVSRHSFRDEAIQKNEATRGQMSPVGPQRSPTYREKVHEQRCRNARKKRDFADRVEVMAAAAVARELGDASTCSISPRSAQIVAEAVATKQVGDVSTSKVSPRSARIKRLVEKGPRTAQSARDLLHHFNKKAEKAQARRKLYKVDSSLSNLSMLPQNEDASATAPDLVPEQVAPSALPVAPYIIYANALFTVLLIASMAFSARYSGTQFAELKGSMALSARYSDTQLAELKGQFEATKENFAKEMDDMLAQKNSELLQMSNELAQKDKELAQKETELAESRLIDEEHRQAHLEDAHACTQAAHKAADGHKNLKYVHKEAEQEAAREHNNQINRLKNAAHADKQACLKDVQKIKTRSNIYENDRNRLKYAAHAHRQAGLEAAQECKTQIDIYKNDAHAYRRACRNQIQSLVASSETAQMLCTMQQLDDALNSTMWGAIQHMFGMQM